MVNSTEPDPQVGLLSGYPQNELPWLMSIPRTQILGVVFLPTSPPPPSGTWGVSYAANLTSDDTGIIMGPKPSSLNVCAKVSYKGGSRPASMPTGEFRPNDG